MNNVVGVVDQLKSYRSTQRGLSARRAIPPIRIDFYNYNNAM
jgi:hypothetical protein